MVPGVGHLALSDQYQGHDGIYFFSSLVPKETTMSPK